VIVAKIIVVGGGRDRVADDLLSETRAPLLSESDTSEVL
jgi:hypothetical protein